MRNVRILPQDALKHKYSLVKNAIISVIFQFSSILPKIAFCISLPLVIFTNFHFMGIPYWLFIVRFQPRAAQFKVANPAHRANKNSDFKS